MKDKIYKMDDIPEKLFNIGERRFFKKGDIIFQSGDTPDFFYILVKGQAISISNTLNGLMIYDVLLLPPSIICESCAINKEEIPSTFMCLENVELLKINHTDIVDILKSDLEVTLYLYSVTSKKYKKIISQNTDKTALSSEQRIVQVLIEFAELLGENIDGKIKIKFKITQQFISDFVGVKRITAYRTFEKLKKENILELIEGDYYINDIDLLRQYLL